MTGQGTGAWRITVSKEGYLSASTEVQVSQIKANPPVVLTLRKESSLEALPAYQEGRDLLDRGNARLKEGRYDEALAAFEEFAAKYPDVYAVRLNIGTVQMEKGDLEKAEAEFRSVLDRNSASPDAGREQKETVPQSSLGAGGIRVETRRFRDRPGIFPKGPRHLARGSRRGLQPRLFDIGILPDLIAGNVIGVIAQRLVRILCSHCKEGYHPSAEERQILGVTDTGLRIYRPTGCKHCSGRGYRGRTAIVEILRMHPDLDELVARRATARELRTAALEKGFRPLVEEGIARILDGTTSIAEGGALSGPHPTFPLRHGRPARTAPTPPRIRLADAAPALSIPFTQTDASHPIQGDRQDRPPGAGPARRQQRSGSRAALAAHGPGPDHLPDDQRAISSL